MYSAYALRTQMLHDGNFSACAKALHQLGYHEPQSTATLTAHGAEKVSAQTLKGVCSNTNLFRTPADIAASGASETEWLAKGYVALGNVSELTGKPKLSGKTTFAGALTHAILKGGSFLGEPCRKMPVVYLTEQGDSSFLQALRRADLVDRADLHILSWHTVRHLSWPQVIAHTAEFAHNAGAGLLIVDTLGRWTGIAGDSENDAGAATAAMEPLKLASASRNLAVLALRHSRKSGGDVGDDGRGSSAFSGEADILLSLRRPEGNHRGRPGVRELQGIGRFEETPDRVLIELKDHVYELLGEEGAIVYAEARDAVDAFLPESKDDALPESTILDAVDAKRTTVQRVLKNGIEDGYIARTGAGKRGDPVRYWRSSGATLKVSAQTSDPMVGQKPFFAAPAPSNVTHLRPCVECGSPVTAPGDLYCERHGKQSEFRPTGTDGPRPGEIEV